MFQCFDTWFDKSRASGPVEKQWAQPAATLESWTG